MILLLALTAIALLLHFPRLRHATGQVLAGWLFVVVMALAFGAVGVLIALVVSLALVYRPAPPKPRR